VRSVPRHKVCRAPKGLARFSLPLSLYIINLPGHSPPSVLLSFPLVTLSLSPFRFFRYGVSSSRVSKPKERDLFRRVRRTSASCLTGRLRPCIPSNRRILMQGSATGSRWLGVGPSVRFCQPSFRAKRRITPSGTNRCRLSRNREISSLAIFSALLSQSCVPITRRSEANVRGLGVRTRGSSFSPGFNRFEARSVHLGR